MGRSSFYTTCNKYTPFVLTSRPRTDLCWTCQQNNQTIYTSANTTPQAKAAKLAIQEEHLRHVQEERQLYQSQVKEAKDLLEANPDHLGPHEPCSRPGIMSYSFDYAQQVSVLFLLCVL